MLQLDVERRRHQYSEYQEATPMASLREAVKTEVVSVLGDPDPKRICTSIVERQNLTMRMQIRRLTWLTKAFSKSWDNLLGRALFALRLLQLLRDS
jgi:IS1 family transposase